jgi:predicted nucleotidyltransferase
MDGCSKQKRRQMNYPLYNDKLAPIWNINEDGIKLDVEIRKQLMKVAMDFAKEIKENSELPFKIEDIVIIGSITNYNWTPYSDIDLHISTDYSKLGMDKEKAQVMFDAIKAGWNNKHNIKMKGFDVELYVEDVDAEQVTASKYSVLRDEWIREPKKQSPNFNKELIKKKYNEYKKEIDNLIQQHDETKLKKLLEKIYNYRQAGLDKGGELSEENIVFRILRAKGHLDRLKDNITKVYDKKMSVKESEKI